MKSLIKYLLIFTALILPVLLFPNKTPLVLSEYALTVLVITAILSTKIVWFVKGNWKQYLSWVVSFFVGLLPWLLNFGIFKSINFPGLILYAILIGFISNGLYDLSWIQKILKWIGVLKTQ